jgi:hypothetical protein
MALSRYGRASLVAMAFTVAALVSSGALAQAPPNMGEQSRVEFEVRRFRSDLVSELRLSTPLVPGTSLDDVETDLGLPVERIWDYHFAIRLMSRLKLRGNWFKVKYEGMTVPTSEICVAGLCTPPGEELDSTMEMEQTRGGAEFNLVNSPYAILAVVGEYGRFRTTTSFASPEGSRSPEPLQLDLPLFGLKGRVYLTPSLGLTVEGVGMKSDSEGVWTDFDASATYSATPNFGLSYGYRNTYIRYKSIETVGDRAVIRLRGQYFAATVRF